MINTPTSPSRKLAAGSEADGYHYVKVQKSGGSYISPLTMMMYERSWTDPKKKLYELVADGAVENDLARTGHPEMVVLRMLDADYQFMLRSNDEQAIGIQSDTAEDEELKRVPQAI